MDNVHDIPICQGKNGNISTDIRPPLFPGSARPTRACSLMPRHTHYHGVSGYNTFTSDKRRIVSENMHDTHQKHIPRVFQVPLIRLMNSMKNDCSITTHGSKYGHDQGMLFLHYINKNLVRCLLKKMDGSISAKWCNPTTYIIESKGSAIAFTLSDVHLHMMEQFRGKEMDLAIFQCIWNENVREAPYVHEDYIYSLPHRKPVPITSGKTIPIMRVKPKAKEKSWAKKKVSSVKNVIFGQSSTTREFISTSETCYIYISPSSNTTTSNHENPSLDNDYPGSMNNQGIIQNTEIGTENEKSIDNVSVGSGDYVDLDGLSVLFSRLHTNNYTCNATPVISRSSTSTGFSTSSSHTISLSSIQIGDDRKTCDPSLLNFQARKEIFGGLEGRKSSLPKMTVSSGLGLVG